MRHRKPRMLKPQIISEGTLRPEDLIPAYLDVLEGLRLSREERKTVDDIARDSEREGYYEDEDSLPSDDIENLATILESHCAPYCYFGASEGDGACFGVWVAHESLKEDIRTGEVWKDDRGEPASVGAVAGVWRYRLVVSDHGNMSLYHRNGRVVWEVV